MLFKDIAGHKQIKEKLIQTVAQNRISHAQLFLGPEGCGKLGLAIAYARYISCKKRTETDSCGTCPSCIKYNKLIHPDLHFVYPVIRTTKFTKPVSDDYIPDWRKFILNNSYHNMDLWLEYIGSENAQAGIFAQESQEIIRKLNLKTFEAEYKIMIIWFPEKMNISASNKLLKMIEEPPPKTLFILVAENEEELLKTIRSRTQLIKIGRLTEEDINTLVQKNFTNIDQTERETISKLANGSYINAINIIKSRGSDDSTSGKSPYFELFTELMRNCYGVKILEITKWVDKIAGVGRERQKSFINYSLRLFRECFMINLIPAQRDKLVYLANEEASFAEKFAQFIHEKNINYINEEFNLALTHIERNAYNKLVFLDLSLKLIKLLKIPKN